MGLERLLRLKNLFAAAPLILAIGCQDYNVNRLPEPCEPCEDSDLDGYVGSGNCPTECITDCDDTNYDISPIGIEVCDDLDNDCNGVIDEAGGDLYHLDSDGDGFGGKETHDFCNPEFGYVLNDDDCNDEDVNVNPAATEICDGIDNDCNGEIDEVGSEWYLDSDGDGFGDVNNSQFDCDKPDGYVDDLTDCDDGNELVFPGAEEVCNLLDDDCEGTIDLDPNTGFSVCPEFPATTGYWPLDNDGFVSGDFDVKDYSVNEVHGTNSNGVYVEGAFLDTEGAIYFDGNNSEIDFGEFAGNASPLLHNSTDSFTIMLWINTSIILQEMHQSFVKIMQALKMKNLACM
ncbi:hypothetical protein CL619_01030 [archaeon]|nr:hypothetical protein [archaeon]